MRDEVQRIELWQFVKMLGRSALTAQQKKTIRGQALAGDLEGAQKGYERLMRAKENARKGRAM